MGNLPILYQNVMYGLPSDFASDVFLWATERPDNDRMCYRAEEFAREADYLRNAVAPMLDMAARVHGIPNPPDGLMDFTLTRHANWRWGGNVKPGYLAASSGNA